MPAWENRLREYCVQHNLLTDAEFNYLIKKQQQLLESGHPKDLLTLLGEEYHITKSKIEQLRKEMSHDPVLAPAGLPIIAEFPQEPIISGPVHRPKERSLSFSQRYELIRQIGSSPGAAYYQAYDQEKKRPVALKVISDEAFQEQASSFLQNAKKIARLRHAHIIPLYESGCQGKEIFCSRAYISGVNLQEYFQHTADPQERCRLVQKIVQAVAYAHEQHIYHLNIKPSNILVSQDGWPYLMDFGQARPPWPADSIFIAPEQKQGQPGNSRSDVYALGALLYYAYTLELPASKELSSHLNALPAPLRYIVTQSLRTKISQRYVSVSQMLEDLEHVLEHGRLPHRHALYRRVLRWSALIFTLVLVGLALLFLFRQGT